MAVRYVKVVSQLLLRSLFVTTLGEQHSRHLPAARRTAVFVCTECGGVISARADYTHTQAHSAYNSRAAEVSSRVWCAIRMTSG